MTRFAVLFLHIVGMLMLFIGFGIEWLSVVFLRRSTTTAEPSSWMRVLAALPRIYGISYGAILVSGIYLAAQLGVYELAWVRVAFATLLVIGLIGGFALRSRRRALPAFGAESDSTAPGSAPARLPYGSGWLLPASLRIRVALALAVVYLMIARLELGGSLLIVGLALAIGAASGWWEMRSQPAVSGSSTAVRDLVR